MARMTINEAVQVAGCSSPEGKDTDGAKWLREVIEAGEEMMDDFNIVDDSYAKYAGSVIFEWADGLRKFRYGRHNESSRTGRLL